MKKMSLKMKTLVVAALTAAASMALATPASAASYYQLRCGYTGYGLSCYYVPSAYGSTSYNWTVYRPSTNSAPTQTAAAKSAPTQPSTKSTTVKSNPAATADGLTAAEQQMLNLVNQERAKVGLAPLKADLPLTKLARLKSQDMINRNYFSHQSPTYGSPFEMMKANGVTYRTAGENIAGNSSVQGAHTALMNSPGHRANILSSKFTHIGIGIQQGGNYGMMFTQMFVGR